MVVAVQAETLSPLRNVFVGSFLGFYLVFLIYSHCRTTDAISYLIPHFQVNVGEDESVRKYVLKGKITGGLNGT